ncbi:hypothetical protein HXX76_001869 [Chlamydomonas incerta]|uniref:Protein kinase domain-containing protein n=1 Tax=Chlamydomonas incerta TaxID=51695 RepID=A0A835WA12_CHLIN|nr:hypothetical protein HXX76_001869 [Chlamydomonas incerta]|eukprot:KAG2443516.1 hypothetical protein HXX76_001869 [Chlamydomonas incerta]
MVGADPTGREQLRTALIACGADLTHFEDTDLDKLWVGRYRNVSSLLEDATWRGLSAAGLPPGLVDQILALQGRAASAAGAGGPDTSHAYMRLALAGAPPQPPGCSGSSSAVLLSGGGNNLQQQLAQHLDQPLAVKLPVGRGLSRDALNSSSELLDYVQEQPLHGLGADARRLTVLMTSVLTGVFEDCWSGAAGSADDLLSGAATVARLRPDFLFWVCNALLFKGEEKAQASALQDAVKELTDKMATSWDPALLPGASMPCMLAYAAAGNVAQFFALVRRDARTVTAAPITGRVDISQPLGRVKVVHYTLKVLQLMAQYAPDAPSIPLALGGMIKAVGSGGKVRSTVVMFQDFVLKRVEEFKDQPGSVMGYDELAELYAALDRARCPNLTRLHGGVIRLERAALVLHLQPVGLPMHGPPETEGALRQALRGVLTAVAALHRAGFVHRDIRWPNVIRLPAAASPSPALPPAAGSPDTFVLIDLEHAARADCRVDCRQPPRTLGSWPDAAALLDPTTGAFTRQSDLRLVAGLMAYLPFSLSDSGVRLQQDLASGRIASADAALAHEWLLATG